MHLALVNQICQLFAGLHPNNRAISPRPLVVLDVVGWVSLLYAESRLFRAHFPSISLPKLSLKARKPSRWDICNVFILK